jgi:hypothetical protein
METIITLTAFVVLTGVFVKKMMRLKKIKKLEQEYRRALAGTDKKTALNAGRSYYSKLRKGKLSVYDEQVIVNDLSRMHH